MGTVSSRTVTIMSNDTPAKEPDLHEKILTVIESQIESLSTGAPASGPDGSTWSTDEVDQKFEQLRADEKELREHWTIGGGQTGAATNDPAALSAACGNKQPCPHVLGLAEKYDVPTH